MTEYFEVLQRDAAARLGELRLTDSLRTPARVDDVRSDAGSVWTAEREVPEGSEDVLTILPHRGFPSGTPDEIQQAFEVEVPDIDAPSAAVVTQETTAIPAADGYVLSGATGIVGHGSAFVEAILEVRQAIPDDTALLLSGVATPGNVALLGYAGVDLVDADKAVVEGTRGRYLTTDGETHLSDLDELPCACPACQGPIDEFTPADCAEHNRNALDAELARVRERIRRGRLRDYIEGQARHEAWVTAAFRHLDRTGSYLRERTPIFRDSLLLSATEDTLQRPEIRRFAERVTEGYTRRLEGVPLLLVPCSAAKPYSDSQSHRQFQEAARYRAHLVSMTSPIGVVPQELELTYPAQHYDSVVTGDWSETEIEFVAAILEDYLDATDYPRIVAHLPADGYREIVDRATRETGLEVTYTVESHPTTGESLSNLDDALGGERTIRVEEKERATLQAVADYQFGSGAGEDLFDEMRLRGRYPKLQALDGDGEQLAALVPQYGTLALTLAGARAWEDSEIHTKRVEIDGFVPHGSVLAPGVVDADHSILVGDEVVFGGPEAFGIGRATMHGAAMDESTRGVAIDVRHVTER